MYGIEVPEGLTNRLQETEVSELFISIRQSDLPDDFECDIPYSGDGDVNVHLGVMLDSTESRSRKVVSKPSAKQKQLFKDGLKKLKVVLDNEAKDCEDQGYPLDEDQLKVFDEFKKLLEEGTPSVYRAYSTS